MRGDFSSWRNERNQNFSGVLHQQGRVLLDSDWNAQTAITTDWQDTEALDVIGSGVAAVPADLPDSFRVTAAVVDGPNLMLTVGCGRAWVDGMLVTLPGTTTRQRLASYLAPPIQSPAGSVASTAAGVRDAVVLEVWREEISGFQLQKLLVEPALGGPDTTERLHTACAFKLYRMGAGETCESIVAELRDRFDQKATLSVTLKPRDNSNDECPVVLGGGYTGFEHNLYRIEIAQTKAAEAWFKWSQYNGGLVGRGSYKDDAITITANDQAIINSRLTSFYLEVLVRDPADLDNPGRGHWRVLCAAPATLDADGKLQLPASAGNYMFGGKPPDGDLFFRLWNGIRKVEDFLLPDKELAYGIHIGFSSADPLKNAPGDYWTFPVRAGEIPNDETLVANAPPEGIMHHRVPLGVITWSGASTVGSIGDCRRIFQPLTRLGTCCTYRVGDGMRSHGDFDSIQTAIDHLPESGGEICVLPGIYRENVRIEGRRNISINGCGERTRLISPQDENVATPLPMVHVKGSSRITLQSLAIEAHTGGVGVLLEGVPTGIDIQSIIPLGDPLTDVTLNRLGITAARRSAIEGHVVTRGSVRDCRIRMRDMASPWPAIFIAAEDFTIEDNIICVADTSDSPAAPALASGGNSRSLDTPFAATAGRGGIQIAGTSERVSVTGNLICGGIGNGITLGSLVEVTAAADGGGTYTGWVINADDPCKPGSVIIVDTKGPNGQVIRKWESAGDLYDIRISGNLIVDMGLNGIGPVAFFEPGKDQELISIRRLWIERNEIRRVLNRDVADIDANFALSMAYGAIVLPDVDDLIVRDNVIADVGSSMAGPACGLFVLHGEGIEIMRNRIAVHPLPDPTRPQPQGPLKPGIRGGIALNAVSMQIAVPPPGLATGAAVTGISGIRPPASVATIHDNQVSTWLGPALQVLAQCPVSVVANEFSTSGFDPSLGIASTVVILDIGMMPDLLFLILAQIGSGREYFSCEYGRLVVKGIPTAGGPTVPPIFPMPNVPSGEVLFADNQCRLDLAHMTGQIIFSSVLVAGLDDVSFHGNQCGCTLGANVILINALVIAGTLKVSDNRFKEGLQNGLLSAFTFGLANMTVHNQADHCLLIRGIPVLTEEYPNTVLMKHFCDDACNGYEQEFMRGFRKAAL